MILVLLYRKNDFRDNGHVKVFSELLSDLKELGDNEIAGPDETKVKETLFCIAGDNLGSHYIGGFSENFSPSKYFCRYCLITKSEFQGTDPNVCGLRLTRENYNSAVNRLLIDNTTSVEGVNFGFVWSWS